MPGFATLNWIGAKMSSVCPEKLLDDQMNTHLDESVDEETLFRKQRKKL